MTSKRDNPAFDAVSDSVDMMKKMWGMAGLPGLPSPGNLASMAVRLPRDLPSMVAPTFDLEELDKRITDLRAVEQWLEINANMLRATIQTLEVQRATIATLKGISGAMLAPMTGRGKAAPEAASFTPPEVAFGARAMATEPVAAPQSSATVAPAALKRHKRSGSKKSAAPVADTPVNPAAWWNTLQDQFTRIAASAAQAAAPAPTKQRAQQKARKAVRKKKA